MTNVDYFGKLSRVSDILFCFGAAEPKAETCKEWAKDLQACYESLQLALPKTQTFKKPLLVQLSGYCVYYNSVFERYSPEKYAEIRKDLMASEPDSIKLSVFRFGDLLCGLCRMEPGDFQTEMAARMQAPPFSHVPSPLRRRQLEQEPGQPQQQLNAHYRSPLLQITNTNYILPEFWCLALQFRWWQLTQV